MLQPHLHAVCVEVFFQVADGQQLLVEDVTRELEKRHVIDHKVKQERMQ